MELAVLGYAVLVVNDTLIFLKSQLELTLDDQGVKPHSVDQTSRKEDDVGLGVVYPMNEYVTELPATLLFRVVLEKLVIIDDNLICIDLKILSNSLRAQCIVINETKTKTLYPLTWYLRCLLLQKKIAINPIQLTAFVIFVLVV